MCNDRNLYNKSKQEYYEKDLQKLYKGMRALILKWTKQRAFEYVLHTYSITCDDNNISSYKIIEKNGGKALEHKNG